MTTYVAFSTAWPLRKSNAIALPNGPEMTLIQQSCENATARIRFFRIAFGTTTDTRLISTADARKVLTDYYAFTRLSATWRVDQDRARNVVQLGYLSLLCLEAAMPQGGTLDITDNGRVLIATAKAETVRGDLPIWDMLKPGVGCDLPGLRPADVQFALLARICSETGVTADLQYNIGHAQLILILPGADV